MAWFLVGLALYIESGRHSLLSTSEATYAYLTNTARHEGRWRGAPLGAPRVIAIPPDLSRPWSDPG
jgi:hypothetical protein